MKQFQKIQWIAFALILILGLVGCESLAPDGRVGPTAPVDVSPDPANLAYGNPDLHECRRRS